jgi:hypothetical protein
VRRLLVVSESEKAEQLTIERLGHAIRIRDMSAEFVADGFSGWAQSRWLDDFFERLD